MGTEEDTEGIKALPNYLTAGLKPKGPRRGTQTATQTRTQLGTQPVTQTGEQTKDTDENTEEDTEEDTEGTQRSLLKWGNNGNCLRGKENAK